MAPEPIVLLHPIALDGTCWPRAVTDLGTTIAPDLPGHGDRRDEPVPASPAALAGDLWDQLGRRGVDGPVHLVGVSTGGMLALHALLEAPDRVASAVVASSAAHFPAEVMAARAAQVDEHGVAAQVPETMARWYTPSAWTGAGRAEAERLRERAGSIPAGSLAATWRLLSHHDLRGRLGGVTVPVTVVVGRDDDARGACEQLGDELPGARVVHLPGAHLAPLQHPAAFAAAIATHLDGLGGAPVGTEIPQPSPTKENP